MRVRVSLEGSLPCWGNCNRKQETGICIQIARSEPKSAIRYGLALLGPVMGGARALATHITDRRDPFYQHKLPCAKRKKRKNCLVRTGVRENAPSKQTATTGKNVRNSTCVSRLTLQYLLLVAWCIAQHTQRRKLREKETHFRALRFDARGRN